MLKYSQTFAEHDKLPLELITFHMNGEMFYFSEYKHLVSTNKIIYNGNCHFRILLSWKILVSIKEKLLKIINNKHIYINIIYFSFKYVFAFAMPIILFILFYFTLFRFPVGQMAVIFFLYFLYSALAKSFLSR